MRPRANHGPACFRVPRLYSGGKQPRGHEARLQAGSPVDVLVLSSLFLASGEGRVTMGQLLCSPLLNGKRGDHLGR